MYYLYDFLANMIIVVKPIWKHFFCPNIENRNYTIDNNVNIILQA